MQEAWVSLEGVGFSSYSVSNFGRIRNDRTRKILSQSPTQSGGAKVYLFQDDSNVPSTRSVALLVATYFLPYQGALFNTPINLNGDRSDNRSCNLAWRPRWFSFKYHKQFNRPPYKFKYHIKLLDSGEVFRNAREASMAYGLLEDDIACSFDNGATVWPFGFRFEELR